MQTHSRQKPWSTSIADCQELDPPSLDLETAHQRASHRGIEVATGASAAEVSIHRVEKGLKTWR